MRVAVDAMGGDHAPRELVTGALDAVRQDSALEVILVGREPEIVAEITSQGGAPDSVRIVHAGDVIGTHESPVDTLKKRPDASILRTLQLMSAGEADAIVAAGSTGAAVAASMMTLKRLPGVRRPGIAVPMPARNPRGICLLIDAGANPDCRPHHLAQYAVMGANYYREVFEASDPRVALVSIGQEESKGNALTKEAGKLIRGSAVNFVGNIEGGDLFGGACEVGVADGFVGNIILKSAEGCAEMILSMVGELAKDDPGMARSLAAKVDYAEFGGAPLLGIDGVVMICHGRSKGRAIANAIRAGARAVASQVNENIVRGLGGVGVGQ